jgi:cholesterol transport system auxiliary component
MSGFSRGLSTLALLVLVGCGSILQPPAPPPTLYRLTPATEFAPGLGTASQQLAVETPMAEAALDTTRIALSRHPTALDYFADAAWTDRLTMIVQARLIDSFDNSHRLAAVGPQGGALHVEIVLVPELRHFEAVYDGASGSPHWQIELAVQLVKLPERTLLAERDFHGDVPAARNELSAIIEAADQAWRGVAKDVVDWTTDRLEQAAR